MSEQNCDLIPASLHRRDIYIDFIRGLAILDMMLVHYSVHFPSMVRKIIIYHDIAMEGFLFLSGFIVGKHYLQKYYDHRVEVTRTLLIRVLKLIIIQYVLIFTISLPQFLLLNRDVNISTAEGFLVQSLLFYNQIGLIHVLPTFIPLFLVAPIILRGFSRGYDWLIILGSVGLFLIGQSNPYILDYGERTIFPIILWQIYFVIGCCIGKLDLRKNILPARLNRSTFLLASILLIIALAFKHTTSISVIFNQFIEVKGVHMSKFPLNLYGLLYGCTIWFFILSATSTIWPVARDFPLTLLVALFGRHSLMVFVIHVYFAKCIEIIKGLHSGIPSVVFYTIMIANFFFAYLILKTYDIRQEFNNSMMRTVQWLFK
jgi:hypothetical protein